MRGYIGVTDGDWAQFLAATGATEVNFWQPSAGRGFRALEYGEPFLFKTHHPDNRIVGGGFFEHHAVLRASEAWDFLREANGAPDLETMIERVARYRRQAPEPDPFIGCIILNDVVFFERAGAPPGPQSMAKNIVSGKSYVLPSDDSHVEFVFELLLAAHQRALQQGEELEPPTPSLGPTTGDPVLTIPRLGQAGFRTWVLDAYGARCAITGHKIRPTLQACHIKPVACGGQHRIDNGLLLRSDVHTMFDRGYLAVDHEYHLRVSPRLREDFGNGESFYEREGSAILLPSRMRDRPNHEYLEWHQDTVFIGR